MCVDYEAMTSVKKSFAWAGVEQFAPKAIQIVVSILLARILAPADFGLLGMLALFMAAAMVFADSGLSASLVQNQKTTRDDETSVFYINIVLGLLLALLLCAISPFVAKFYGQDLLVPLLCVQSISLPISSFAIVQGAIMTRAMEFRAIALITLAATLTTGAVGLGMAYYGYGVWSLIGASLAGNITRVILYWAVSSWRPRGKLRISNIRSIWNFSSFLLYCQLIGIVYQNMYSVIIGKFYSVNSLGYYNRANNLHMLPAGVMSGMIGKVAFPLFSKMQDDKIRLLAKMRQLIRISLMFSAAGMALLAIIADPLIPLLMTEKWLPAVPLLRVLCYSAMIYPISSMFLMVLQAQGHSKLNFRLESIKMVIGVIVVLSVAQYGVLALVWSVVALRSIAYFINVWYHVKFLGYRWRDQAFDILPTFAICGVAAYLSWQVALFELSSPLLLMITRSIAFIGVVVSGVILLRKVFFADLWEQGSEMLRHGLNKLRRA